jgi:hypothetical protein
VIFFLEYRQALRLLSKMRKAAPGIRKCGYLVGAYSGNPEQHLARSNHRAGCDP